MRKFLFLAACVLSILFPFASYAANGIDSFEDGDWIFSAPNANGTAEIDATVFRTGAKCLKINVITATPTTPWTIFGNKAGFGSVKINKKYKLIFWAKTDAANQEIRFGFNIAGTITELNSDYSSLKGALVNSSNWAQYEISFVASQTSAVDIYFHGAATPGVIYIDDLFLEEQPMTLNDPGFETQNWWLGGVPVNNKYTSANGSFTYDNTVQRSGNWSLKVDTDNPNNPWDMMASCGGGAFEKNKEYKVSFWARGDGDGNNRQLTVSVANALAFPTILDDISWKQYSFTFICDAANAGKKDLTFQAGGSYGIFWIDDIEIVELIKEPLLRYGYETNNLLPVNSGFEFGTAGGFTTIPSSGTNAIFVNDNTDSYEGYNSLKVAVNTASPTTFWDIQVNSRAMKVVKDHNYILSFWAKADNGQKIDVKFANTDNVTWANGEKQFTLTNEWTRYYYETTSNITTSGQRGALLTFMFGRSAGLYWIDNIVLADMDTLNFNTNLPELLNTEYSTQLRNGNFELNGLESWTVSSDASLLNVGAKNGANAVRIATADASILDYNSYLKQSNITLAANKTYLVSFWAKANNLLYLKSAVKNNEMPLTGEFTAKLSKDWKRYEYFITTGSNWNINTDKADLSFGAAYQKGTFDIDDVILTNFEATADAGTSALSTVNQELFKCKVNNGNIEVFSDNFRNYEILNLSGQQVSSGLLNQGKAQFKHAIIDGLYLIKLTKFDGTLVANKIIVK